MTAVERPQMLVEEFEELARGAARSAEGLRLEFIGGRLGVKAVPDGDHGTIVQWLSRVCIQARPELWLYVEQGLRVERYRSGRARPDGSLTVGPALAGQGEWADPGPVLMAVEITSADADTDRRDRVEKPLAYAEAAIPLYLLIDRDAGEVRVYSEPSAAGYRDCHVVAFGGKVRLPEPVGFTLDTDPLLAWR